MRGCVNSYRAAAVLALLSALVLAAPARGQEEAMSGDSLGLVPLTDMGDSRYRGFQGGLYGGGKNAPPPAHVALARRQLARIEPLGPDGSPSADGKIVLISIGMSNTTMEFGSFKEIADASPLKSPNVLIVDTAQGGRTAAAWANSLPEGARSESGGTVWDEADRRIKAAGATPAQVQAVWIKVAGRVRSGWLEEYRGDLVKIACLARARYPSLKIAYFSSRIYAGYATTRLNPEPWSYEGGFAVQQVIQQQMSGDSRLSVEDGKAPVLLWGPYLWADGIKPRKLDGLIWNRSDFAADGTHPSRAGRGKVARMLLKFFTTDPLARSWFCGE